MTDYSTDFVKKCATDEVYNGELVSPLEFDRWLNEERAKAWDEGKNATRYSPGAASTNYAKNPYRKANQ